MCNNYLGIYLVLVICYEYTIDGIQRKRSTRMVLLKYLEKEMQYVWVILCGSTARYMFY